MGASVHAMRTDAANVTRKDKGKVKARCLNVTGLKIPAKATKSQTLALSSGTKDSTYMRSTGDLAQPFH